MTAVFPWRADGPGRADLGVTDDAVLSRDHAGACLLDWAVSAVVEEAATGGLGAQTLAGGYPRTGPGWRASLDGRGRVRWSRRAAAA